MTVTKVLGAQAGIQYSGVSDKSEADPTVQLLNSVVFGQFKRGRFDKPFKVTSESIRAKLGYDPTNKDYVAVEDALASGAPFVWVMRVKSGPALPKITCADATNSVGIKNFIFTPNGIEQNGSDTNFAVEVNDKWYNEDFSQNNLEDVFIQNNIPLRVYKAEDGYFEVYANISIGEWRVRLKPSPEQSKYSTGYLDRILNPNPCQSYENGIFSFCLANDSMPT